MFLSGVKMINLTRNRSLKSPSHLIFFWKIFFSETFLIPFQGRLLLGSSMIELQRFCTCFICKYRNSKSDNSLLQLVLFLSYEKVVILKFMYSEKAIKFCEIFIILLSQVEPVKSKVKISQNFVAFSEYMNFKSHSYQV